MDELDKDILIEALIHVSKRILIYLTTGIIVFGIGYCIMRLIYY